MSPTHNKTSQRWHIKLEGRKKNEKQQENTRPPPIFGWHACSSLMFQVWKGKKHSVCSLRKKDFCLQYAETAFEESTTQRGLLLPVSAAPCSGKAQCLCSHLKCVLISSWPDMKQSFNPTFPFVCRLEYKKKSYYVFQERSKCCIIFHFRVSACQSV